MPTPDMYKIPRFPECTIRVASSAGIRNVFMLVLSKKTHFFSAGTEDSMELWANILRECIGQQVDHHSLALLLVICHSADPPSPLGREFDYMWGFSGQARRSASWTGLRF